MNATGTPGDQNSTLRLLAGWFALASLATLAGIFAALLGTRAGDKTIYFCAILAVAGVGMLITATRPEPMRFAFLALVLAFPMAAAAVPPGRLGFSIFDVVMMALALGLLFQRLTSLEKIPTPLFPGPSWLVVWGLVIPTIVLSQFPVESIIDSFALIGAYAFFLLALAEFRRDRGFERLTLLFAWVTIVAAVGLFIDAAFDVNLSLRESNMNEYAYSGGVLVRRAGGFFGDPQRAGSFLACLITYLLLLSIRGRFRGMPMRFVVWAAIILSIGALATTVSRSAIFASLLVSTLALFAFNNWNGVLKVILLLGVAGLVVGAAMTPWEIWLAYLPSSVVARFLDSQADIEIRMFIWFDTWDMFANHPINGIGPGSFQSYLMETRMGVTNFYGIGESQGVTYIPDQPENGYLKILYEGGILGAVAALIVVVDTVRRAIKVTLARDVDPNASTECIAALAGLATLAVTFVTLFQFADGRMTGLLCLFLAAIWHRSTIATAGAGESVTTGRMENKAKKGWNKMAGRHSAI